MLTIETKRETVVKYSLHIELDLDEINKILVDPRDFQKQLRTFRNSFSPKRSTWSTDGHAHGDPPNKVRSKKTAPAKAGGEFVECPKCHEMFKPRGLMIHLRSCTGESASPRSAASVDLE